MDLLSEPLNVHLPNTAWDTRRAPFVNYAHSMPPFPYVTETRWGLTSSVDQRMKDLCRPLHRHFCLKDRREVVISFMRYRRVGPKVLSGFKNLVVTTKKRRQGISFERSLLI